ncbi:unnamed protein product [Amaranthus hypochondriacus]
MAEAIAGEVVSFIAEKLGSRAYKEIMFAKDLDSHIKRLSELKTVVEATLLDADSTESCSNAQRDVLDKLSCALAELDDFLDEKAACARQKEVMHGNKLVKEVRLFFSKSNQVLSVLKDSHKFKAIMHKFECIAKNHSQFGTIICMPSVNQTQMLSTESVWSHVITDVVIGRDGDRDNVVRELFASVSSETPSVVSVVGIGGVGKTTLAQYVYHDDRVKSYFDVCFWVSTTRDFNVKEVLQKIVASVMDENPFECEMDQLYDSFLRAISEKKFLLVLDNIWDQDGLRLKWLQLKRLLGFGAKGSKVLITTRFQTVAGVLDSIGSYPLKDLTEDDSWLLFQKIAFTHWQDPGVEAIGQEIVRMCRNVPLVIRSIGGLLAGKQTIQEWQAFRDDQLANFSSYGRDIMQTLKFSYDQLDSRIKLCVAYCSLFPKGFVYDKYELIRLWISLGYIEPQYRNQSLEEAGEAYMLCLVNYNFFQLYSSDRDNLGLSFKVELTMHDLMHDLMLSIAGFKHKRIDSTTLDFDERVRHVSFGDTMLQTCSVGVFSYFIILNSEASWEIPSSLFKIKHLKSLLLTMPPHCKLILKNLSTSEKYIPRFSGLRVLDLHDLGIKKMPRSVGELLCLRYLNLSWNPIVKLPDSITGLVNLLSLDLFGCNKLRELPREMSKLTKLRYLYIKRCDALSHMPMGFGNLRDLQILDTFIFNEQKAPKRPKANAIGGLAELNHLNNLTKGLKISMSTMLKDAVSQAKDANLKSKDKLTRLHLEFKDGKKDNDTAEMVIEHLRPNTNLRELVIDGYTGNQLPSWMRNELDFCLPNLVYLTIYNCQGCQILCSFGKLPRLTHLYLLRLDNLEFIEDSSNDMRDALHAPLFPSLEVLSLEGLPNLKGWWRIANGDDDSNDLVVNKPAFPKLKHICVDDVEKIDLLKREFKLLINLDRLTLSRCEYCLMGLVDRLKEATGEDWLERRHNPDVCVSSKCKIIGEIYDSSDSEEKKTGRKYKWNGDSKGKTIVYM